MRPRSIRFRITGLAAILVAVVLAAVAVVVLLVLQAELRANLDNSLEQRADQIESQIMVDPEAGLANSNDEDRFAQVLDREGRVLFATTNLTGEAAVVPIPSGEQSIETRDDLPLEDDGYRVLIHRFREASGDRYVIVGENIDDVRDSVRALGVTLGIVLPVAVLVLAAVVWWLVGRTLLPVEQIRRKVADIGADELDRRVPVPTTDDELAELAATMNDMLARLESSTGHQRQFVADASHELRTPLTRMRTALEVELGLPDGDLVTVGRTVLGDAIEMQELIDDLLFLARRDAGEGGADDDRVDLDVIVEVEVRRLRDASPAVEISMAGVSAAEVRGDAAQLTRLVRNLLSNAARHAASRVDVSLTESRRAVELIVDDDGPGVPSNDRERVFERFVRLDQARSGRSGGAGLGLAIAADIAASHRASISIGDSPSGGARFMVRFAVADQT
jgi:signal transduction histidine kinase